MAYNRPGSHFKPSPTVPVFQDIAGMGLLLPGSYVGTLVSQHGKDVVIEVLQGKSVGIHRERLEGAWTGPAEDGKPIGFTIGLDKRGCIVRRNKAGLLGFHHPGEKEPIDGKWHGSVEELLAANKEVFVSLPCIRQIVAQGAVVYTNENSFTGEQ